jgi:hypothetical protein
MSKVIKECNGCSPTEKGHERPAGTNGHLTYDDCTEVGTHDDAAKQEADALLQKLRAANKQIVLQSQRIEELESYLHCIVSLSAKVRELELDASL